MIEYSKKYKKMPEYIFEMLYNDINKLKNRDIEVIDMGAGTSKIPPVNFIKDNLIREVKIEDNYNYPNTPGLNELWDSISYFYSVEFGINLNPNKEILVYHGSKEGMAKVAPAFSDPNDIVLIPDPMYAIFQYSSILNNNEIKYLPLMESNEFYPMIERLSPQVLKKTKILFLNYPNVPTTANTCYSFFEKVISLAQEYDFLVVNDGSYNLVYYDKKPISILNVPGSKEVAIEFNSFSHAFGIPGIRLGYAVGGEKNIEVLKRMEIFFDSGVFNAIQKVGAKILKNYKIISQEIINKYSTRREILLSGLKDIGIKVYPGNTTTYLWTKFPTKKNSYEIYNILKEFGVIVTPGSGFGEYGKGYIRFCFAREENEIKKGLQIIKRNWNKIVK